MGDRSIEGTALAEREVLGTARGKDAVRGELYAPGEGAYLQKEYDITKPATPAARAWEGWGTALKPAWEPIILARRPVVGTVAQNLLANGTGALNVNGCLIGTEVIVAGDATPERIGRWPANLVLDQEAALQLDQQTMDDSGGVSRFFYTAKSSSGERHYAGKNTHPTVKPVDLMRWLCRLITPKGGLVLDPFMGSGSTGVAALAEGFRFLGIDREAEFVAIARKRIAGPLFAAAEEEASR